MLEIKKLQNKIFELVIYFDNFCKKNNISYYLMGGSALGAVRHSGFIPWDDDFDIFITESEFNKLCKVISDFDSKLYYFQKHNTKEWPMPFSKIRINNTTFIETEENINVHQGIFIDLFVLKKASNNDFLRRIQYLCGRFLTSLGLSRRNYVTKNKSKIIILKLMRILPYNFTYNFISFIHEKLAGKDSKYYIHCFGKAKYINSYYPKNLFEKYKNILFEGKKLPVPYYVEDYLKIRYGNYNIIPKKDEIDAVIHAKIVDLKKDYKFYLNHEKGDFEFSKEKK